MIKSQKELTCYSECGMEVKVRVTEHDDGDIDLIFAVSNSEFSGLMLIVTEGQLIRITQKLFRRQSQELIHFVSLVMSDDQSKSFGPKEKYEQLKEAIKEEDYDIFANILAEWFRNVCLYAA